MVDHKHILAIFSIWMVKQTHQAVQLVFTPYDFRVEILETWDLT